ncbi:DMT family transporter [Holosporaceae bacterium 'Namur']|nr:DMT family transporter [Holosporaceae bacterium 'Namur']
MTRKNAFGIYWMIFHGITLTLMFALGKTLSQKMDVMQMIFTYHLIALLITLSYTFTTGFEKIKTSRIKIHFLRGSLNVCGYITYFYGLKFTTLDSATSITYLIPIFLSYLGTIFFNEKLNRERIITLILGLTGVLVILRPGAPTFEITSLWVFVSVILWSASDLLTKNLGRTENALSQVFYNTLFGSLLSAPFAAYGWQNVIVIDDFFIITLISLLSLAATTSIFRSFQNAEFSIVMPFDYLRLPLSTVLGYLMFGEIMEINTIIGSTIIVFASLYLIYSERKKPVYTITH